MTTVFICIDWFLPAYKAGGPIQSIANLINNFNKNISYKIFCSNQDEDGEILKGIEYDKWIHFNSYTQVWYASSKTRSIKVLRNQVENSKADVLFINGIYSLFFNIVPILFCNAKRKIVSARGMLHPGALSQKKKKKKAFLFLWKILKLSQYCYFHAADLDEKKYIKNIFGEKTKVFVAKNFPKIINNSNEIIKEKGELRLVSVALISPMKNILLVLKALELIKNPIVYNIYGPVKDEIYGQKCFDQIKKMPSNISVKYNGDINPAKVEEILSENHVFILPSKSENFGHAIYEAFSAGKPVITSNDTPWNNLQELKAGINVNINTTIEVVNAIKFFAEMNSQEFNSWKNCALQYASKVINLEDIKEQYLEMFMQ